MPRVLLCIYGAHHAEEIANLSSDNAHLLTCFFSSVEHVLAYVNDTLYLQVQKRGLEIRWVNEAQ